MEQEEIALIARNEHQETDRTATDASNRETTPGALEEHRDRNNVPAQEDPIVPSDLEPQEGDQPRDHCSPRNDFRSDASRRENRITIVEIM